MQKCFNSLFQNQCPLFVLPLHFWRISQPQGQDQQNLKWTLYQLPHLSFQINRKAVSFHVPINSLGLYLSPVCLLNFLSNLYIRPWLGKILKFMVFRFLKNASQKIEFKHFYSCPQSKLSSRLLSSPPGKGKLLISHTQRVLKYLFSPPWFPLLMIFYHYFPSTFS